MNILNSIPLIGIAIGVFLLFIIIPDRSYYVKNRQAKLFLISIILINIFEQSDSLLEYNNITLFHGLSYLFYHIHGFLFFLFINALLKNSEIIKRWSIIMVAYFLVRSTIIIYIDQLTPWDNIEVPTLGLLIIWLDVYLSNIMNIVFLFWSFNILRKIKFAVKLTDAENYNVNWLKRFIILSVIIYVAIIQYNLISDYKSMDWIKQAKIENLFTNLLFFILAVFAIRFPIFSIYGDFQEDSSPEAKKYSNSTLQKDKSNEIWKLIQKVIINEQAYLNQEYRLNNLAERCNSSVHHISQVINENAMCSFSDYLNKQRIQKAKNLLLSKQSEQFTILAIAYEVGFNSKTAFYNAFKKELGTTPSLFKKKQLNN